MNKTQILSKCPWNNSYWNSYVHVIIKLVSLEKKRDEAIQWILYLQLFFKMLNEWEQSQTSHQESLVKSILMYAFNDNPCNRKKRRKKKKRMKRPHHLLIQKSKSRSIYISYYLRTKRNITRECLRMRFYVHWIALKVTSETDNTGCFWSKLGSWGAGLNRDFFYYRSLFFSSLGLK